MFSLVWFCLVWFSFVLIGLMNNWDNFRPNFSHKITFLKFHSALWNSNKYDYEIPIKKTMAGKRKEKKSLKWYFEKVLKIFKLEFWTGSLDI